jgi:helix-turn-helix, Psq domain
MQQEGRIALAIDTLKQGHFTSVRDTAKSYDLIYSTLQHRVNRRLAKCNLRPTNYKLTDIEESTLV